MTIKPTEPNNSAIVCLIFGILSFLLFWIPIINFGLIIATFLFGLKGCRELKIKKEWGKGLIIAGIIICIIAFILILSTVLFGPPFTFLVTEKVEKIYLKGLTPLKVVQKYNQYSSFEEYEQAIEHLEIQQQMTTSYKNQSILEEILFYKDQIINRNKFKYLFDEIYSSPNVLEYIKDSVIRINNTFNEKHNYIYLSYNLINETNDKSFVMVSFWLTISYGLDNETIENNVTYVLLKEKNVWKISDIMLFNGTLESEMYPISEKMKSRKELYQEKDKIFSKYAASFFKLKKLSNLNNEIKEAISKTIDSSRIIKFNIYDYKTEEGKLFISIIYYFKGKFLSSNYITTEYDAAGIFKSVFPIYGDIEEIEVISKESYKDDYGYTQERYLSKISMNRDTYNQIEWGGFEATNLDKITPVSFYGNSLYKDLKDLQAQMGQYQSGSYPGVTDDLPSYVCSDAKTQCQSYGECETYEMLQSIESC